MSALELLARLAHHARERATSVAAREVGLDAAASITYAQLAARAGGVARAARSQLPLASTVILLTANRVEYAPACLGLWAAGCTVLPMHPSAEREVLAAAARTNARLIITDSRYARISPHTPDATPVVDLREFLAAAGEADLPPDAGAHAALLLQSSGTTGLPKIVHRPTPAIDAVARNVADAVGLHSSDRVFAAAPICHAYGVENGFLAPLWAGATLHLCDGLDLPVALREFAGQTPAQGSTVFPGVPFMFEVLAKTDGLPHPSLRLAYSAGGMLPQALAEAFQRRFGLRVGQLYGASELGSVTFNHPDHPAADPMSVGRPMHAVSIRILDPSSYQGVPDEGMVAIRAPSMMSGYIGEDANLVDGHFITGDLGRISPDGALTITGRLKQLIDIGGIKVNPAEVEGVLASHPDIRECAVVGVPVTPTVSRLKAVVVPVNGSIDPQALRCFVRERLAGHKVPRLIEVVPALPRSPSGKVLRVQLEQPA